MAEKAISVSSDLSPRPGRQGIGSTTKGRCCPQSRDWFYHRPGFPHVCLFSKRLLLGEPAWEARAHSPGSCSNGARARANCQRQHWALLPCFTGCDVPGATSIQLGFMTRCFFPASAQIEIKLCPGLGTAPGRAEERIPRRVGPSFQSLHVTGGGKRQSPGLCPRFWAQRGHVCAEGTARHPRTPARPPTVTQLLPGGQLGASTEVSGVSHVSEGRLQLSHRLQIRVLFFSPKLWCPQPQAMAVAAFPSRLPRQDLEAASAALHAGSLPCPLIPGMRLPEKRPRLGGRPCPRRQLAEVAEVVDTCGPGPTPAPWAGSRKDTAAGSRQELGFPPAAPSEHRESLSSSRTCPSREVLDSGWPLLGPAAPGEQVTPAGH